MDKVITAYKRGYRITEGGKILNPKGIEIKGSISKGRKSFGIRLDGKVKDIMVHRLQAFQKYGEVMFLEGVDVRHKNGISLDNTFENILIGTKSQNQMDIPEAIRVSRAIYASSFIIKHDHLKIKNYHKENGNSYKKTMCHFNISSKGTLNYILNK